MSVLTFPGRELSAAGEFHDMLHTDRWSRTEGRRLARGTSQTDETKGRSGNDVLHLLASLLFVTASTSPCFYHRVFDHSRRVHRVARTYSDAWPPFSQEPMRSLLTTCTWTLEYTLYAQSHRTRHGSSQSSVLSQLRVSPRLAVLLSHINPPTLRAYNSRPREVAHIQIPSAHAGRSLRNTHSLLRSEV